VRQAFGRKRRYVKGDRGGIDLWILADRRPLGIVPLEIFLQNGGPIPWRGPANFFRIFNGELSVQSCRQKFFAMPVGQIISTNSRYPAPLRRGVSRSSQTWVRDAVDAAASGA
jgi:hypothetical protein